MTDQDSSSAHRRNLKELLRNQIWQSANFLSKAGFLILLTPMMRKLWGADGYGLFALSSSLLVSLALLDGGVRALTRLRLAEAIKTGDDNAFRRHYAEGLFTFLAVFLAAQAVALALGLTGCLTRWLNLPPGGDAVLVITFFLTGLLMASTLGLEPLAARGNLSAVKAANTWGALIAIPLAALAVWMSASVMVVVSLYAVCLILPNFVVAAQCRLYELAPWREFRRMGPRVVFETLHSGAWFYLTTVSLMVKTHVLTFVVSAMAGPAEAGVFYILLRLTEIIGNIGATASETSLASLASAPTAAEKAASFRHSWQYVSVFCLHGAICFIFLGDKLIHLWLGTKVEVPHGIGVAIAVFGLSGAFSRVIVNVCMALPILRQAAQANLTEASVDVVLAAFGFHAGGLFGLFIGGSVGAVLLIPSAVRIRKFCSSTLHDLYIKPLIPLLMGLTVAAVVQAGAGMTHSPVLWFASLAVAGAFALLQLKRIHSS